MKTIFKTYSPEQAKEKAREYAEKYAVKFDFYHTGNGWRIVPVATRDTVEITDRPVDETTIIDYLKYWRNGVGFETIANTLGYTVADVVGISWHLIKTARVAFDTDRLGNAAAIRPVERK
jgi:hypothetical protein